MAVTLASFRAAYPEFSAAQYPDATITYNLGFASRLLDQVRWGELYDDGIMLVTAHNLVVSAPSAVGASGRVSGTPIGIATSQSVGSVSKSIDTGIGLQDGAGLYGATSYGRRYYQLLTMIGAGGIQL